MDPDPWIATTDWIDSVISTHGVGSTEFKVGIAVYEETLLEMIGLYKRIREIQGGDYMRRPMSPADIFYTGKVPGQQGMDFDFEPPTPAPPPYVKPQRGKPFFPKDD